MIYDEALDILKKVTVSNGGFDIRPLKDFKYLNEQVKIIEQGLECKKPMKPLEDNYCPSCNTYLGLYDEDMVEFDDCDYCPFCGQKIERGDNK